MEKVSLNIVTPLEKNCRQCGVRKSVRDFYKDRGKPAGQCKECRLSNSKKYVKSLPNEVFKARRQKYNGDYGTNAGYKRNYGLSLDIVRKILQSQSGQCANENCKREIFLGRDFRKSNRANLDHNHTTGKIRGLLCMTCNSYLGMYENTNRMAGLIKYLAKYDVLPVYAKEII